MNLVSWSSIYLVSSTYFCRLDKKKFFVVGAGLFTGVTAALYPVSVVKTRLQVASKDTLERSAFSVVKGLLKTDGIPGLYKGFGTVIIGAIPTRIIFLTALETTKVASFRVVEPFRLSETTQAAIANGIAGMASSFLSQTLFVPIDVVWKSNWPNLSCWAHVSVVLYSNLKLSSFFFSFKIIFFWTYWWLYMILVLIVVHSYIC